MSSKGTLKLARELLDRFFRDAEGRTNRQLDVYFTLEDSGVSRDKADPALEYLTSRGLLNTFGPDIAFLTEEGCRVAAEDVDLESIPRVVRDFERVPPAEPPGEPSDEPEPIADEERVRPDRPLLTHVHIDGSDRVLELGWLCTIGRAEANDIRVEDKRASKYHAELRFEDGGYVLHDLESANGTLVNGEYVIDPRPIDHDDEIVIGRTLLLFQCPEVLTTPAGPPPDTAPPHRESTPAPDIAPTERPSFGDPTPIPPTIPVFPGQPVAETSWPERSPGASASAEARTEALPGGEAAAPRPLEPEADLDFLDPDALVPLEEHEEPVDLASAPEPEPEPASPEPEIAAEAFADTVRSTRAEEADEAATIMTTRAALFGEGPVAGETPHLAPSAEPELPPETAPEPLPPEGGAGRPEITTDPGMRYAAEPAFLTLLGHVRSALERSQGIPEQDRLIEAIDLLRGHPEVARLARAIEDEFSDV